MKIHIKFFIAGIVILIITIFISRCNSRQKLPTFTATDTIDSTALPEEPETPAIENEPVEKRKPLTLVINNLESTTAPVIVGVYGTKNKFPDLKDQLKIYSFKPHGKELSAEIANLKFGTYALAIYQDVNSSGKIDKNLIGIPTEPYAFSNNYKPTIKAPGFADCSFNYNATENTVTMSLIK